MQYAGKQINIFLSGGTNTAYSGTNSTLRMTMTKQPSLNIFINFILTFLMSNLISKILYGYICKTTWLVSMGIETTIFRVGMRSVNPSIKLSCSLFRETTQVWLLPLCLPSLTGSGGINSSMV